MISRVYLVGYEGNMARRHRACLDYLGIEHCGFDASRIDIGDTVDTNELKKCDGIIIATPTSLHENHIKQFACFEKPMLVEKPISLESFFINGGNVQMVNQYAFCGPFPGGDTFYNNWNTGKDGLAWDCINIIGLANGRVSLENTSPIWKCCINGKDLTLADVDMSYINMIDSWTKNPTSNTDYF